MRAAVGHAGNMSLHQHARRRQHSLRSLDTSIKQAATRLQGDTAFSLLRNDNQGVSTARRASKSCCSPEVTAALLYHNPQVLVCKLGSRDIHG
jgi:hypothetical protein